MRFSERRFHQTQDAVKIRIAPGVRPATQAFLERVKGTEAYQQLDPRRRELIDVYFGSTVSLRDLRPLASVGSDKSVKALICSGLTTLWEKLPPDLQAAHPAEEVILLKTRSENRPLSEEARRKISEARRGKPTTLGRAHTEETREKMSEAHKGKTASPQDRVKMSEAQRQRWQRHREAKTGALTRKSAEEIIFDVSINPSK